MKKCWVGGMCSSYVYTSGQQVNFLEKGVRRARRFPEVDSRELCLRRQRGGREGRGQCGSGSYELPMRPHNILRPAIVVVGAT